MKRSLFPLLLLFASTAIARTEGVTLLQFSDYHSHALPLYSERSADQGGIARAIAYLRGEKRKGALIFSGGDMINNGSPSWSDKFGCVEWPWLNGIVDAMAFGNHDADYGSAAFDNCRKTIRYPILSANTVGADGRPLFLDRGKPYLVLRSGHLRIGVFAIAGPDFESLVRPAARPAAGAHFTPAEAAAARVVRDLREKEHVNAVVLIGHEQMSDDFALARSIPGIDLIFGTHSHLKIEPQQIDGTSTWYLAPYQYLTWISRARLLFDSGKLTRVEASLVRVDASMPEDRKVARRVESLERELETDPKYSDRFVAIGSIAAEISTEGQLDRDSELGDLVTDIMRDATSTDVAMATSSTFRQSLPPGAITGEQLLGALPYDNEIVRATMSGKELEELLRYSASLRGTDLFSQISGARLTLSGSQVTAIVVARAADHEYGQIDPNARYTVATTDFQAFVASGYREHFASATKSKSGLHVRALVEQYVRLHLQLQYGTDGRISN